ncbi:MAG: hypothetical protein Q7J69_05335 [Candidatus Omnitrophota bacterium]|nr:hypothetical protein [Candidatus Omnitrophota bacterium]
MLFLIASLALPPQSAWALRSPSTRESAGLKQLTAGLEEGALPRQERKRQVWNSLGGIPAPGQLAVALGVNNSEVRVSMNVSADQPPAFLLNAVLRQDDLSAHPLMPLFPVPPGEPGLYTARFDLRKFEEALLEVDPSVEELRAQLETPLPSRDRPALAGAIGVTLAKGFASADEARRRIDDLKKQHPTLAPQMDQAVARVREVISRELRFHGLVMDSIDRLRSVAVGGQVPFSEASADLDKILEGIEFWPRNHVAVQSLIDQYRQQGTPAPIDVVEGNWKSFWEGAWQERLQMLPQTVSADALNAVYYPAIWLELHEQLEQGGSSVSDRYLEGIGLQLLWLAMEQVATAFWLKGAKRVEQPSQNGIPISGDRVFLLKPGETQTSWQVVREVTGSPSMVSTGTPAPLYSLDRVSPLWKEGDATAIALGFTSLTGFPDVDQWERFFEDGFYLQSQLPGRPEIWMAVTDLEGAVRFYRPRIPAGDLKQWMETYDGLTSEIRNMQGILGDLFPYVWTQISYLPEDQIRALLALPPRIVLGQPRPPPKSATAINQETVGHKGQIVVAARGFQSLIRTRLGKHFGDSSVQLTMNLLEERLPEELKGVRSVQFEQVPDVISRLLYLTALILSESYAQSKLPLDTVFEEVIIPGVSPEPVIAPSTSSSSAPSVRFPIPAPVVLLSKPGVWAERQAELDRRMGKMLPVAVSKLKLDPSMTGLPVKELVEAFALDWVVSGTMTKRVGGSPTQVPILPSLQAGPWSAIDASAFAQAFLAHRNATATLLDEIAASGDTVVADPKQLNGLFDRLNSEEITRGGPNVTARVPQVRRQLFERHLELSLVVLQQQAPLSPDGVVDASGIQAFQQQVRLARESWSALAVPLAQEGGDAYRSEALDRARAWSEAASQMTTLVSHLAVFSSPSNGSYGNSWKVLNSYLGQARNLLPALGPNWESWAGSSLRSAVERFLLGLFGRLNELEALPTENSKWGETQNLYDEAQSFLFEESRLRDSWLNGSGLLSSFDAHREWFAHRRVFIESRNLSEANIRQRRPFTLRPNQQMALAIYDEDGHMTDDWILIRPKQIHPEDRLTHEKRVDVAMASHFHSVETVSGRKLGALLQRDDRALDFLRWSQEVGRKELPDDANPPDSPRIEEVTLGIVPDNGRRSDLIALTQPFAAFHQTAALKQYVEAAGIQSLADVKRKGPQLLSTLINDAPLSIELASVEDGVVSFRVFQQIVRTDDQGQSTGEHHYPYIVTIQDQPEQPPAEGATAGVEEVRSMLIDRFEHQQAFSSMEQQQIEGAKRRDAEYAITLPLPGAFTVYVQQDQSNRLLFSVEQSLHPPSGVQMAVEPISDQIRGWDELGYVLENAGLDEPAYNPEKLPFRRVWASEVSNINPLELLAEIWARRLKLSDKAVVGQMLYQDSDGARLVLFSKEA